MSPRGGVEDDVGDGMTGQSSMSWHGVSILAYSCWEPKKSPSKQVARSVSGKTILVTKFWRAGERPKKL